jgi:GNAT superfamily N-acetyltransferase
MAHLVVSSTSSLDADAAEVVHAGLRAFNDRHAGPGGRARVQLFVRDEDGSVRGGLLGARLWGWLHVEELWVDDSLRGQGWGTKLLAQAEAEARHAGCTRALLDTFEFQALPFYERRGYAVFGVLDDFPPGYRRYYLKKDLSARLGGSALPDA